MRSVKISVVFLGCGLFLLVNGCTELQDLKVRNAAQEQQIEKLSSELQTTRLKSQQVQRKLGGIEAEHKAQADALQHKLAALEEDLGRKRTLISSMQKQLVYGGASIPVELSTALEDFAKAEAMADYDSSRGVVKFKSDLLFEKGSDVVELSAARAIRALCRILSSEQGKKFDVVVGGHTDDIQIQRPQTRQKHPTNWHLSAHRAISVLEMMMQNKIAPERLSVRGFGEYRPVEPNKPKKKGNPQNRRVEIYIVPKGM